MLLYHPTDRVERLFALHDAIFTKCRAEPKLATSPQREEPILLPAPDLLYRPIHFE
jgi:hypothetical protein